MMAAHVMVFTNLRRGHDCDGAHADSGWLVILTLTLRACAAVCNGLISWVGQMPFVEA